MEKRDEVKEFLEDLFDWMDLLGKENVTKEDIIGFMQEQADSLQAEIDGLSAIYHYITKTQEILKKNKINPGDSGNSETNFDI